MNCGPNGEPLSMTDEDFVKLPPVLGWKVWLSDGAEWTMSSEEDWWDDVPHCILVLVTYHHCGRQVWTSRDHYKLPHHEETRAGVEIDDEAYERIRQAALADDWRPSG